MARQTSATIAELYTLATSGSVGDRTRLVNLVSDLRFSSGRELSPQEQILANDILKQLVQDDSDVVKAELAERLAREADAPKELVLCLALDVIEVARPILRHSECLWDAELIKIIRSGTEDHRLTIAARKSVSSAVADALISLGEASVVSTVLQNTGTSLPRGTAEFLNEQTNLLELARDTSAAGRKKLVACVGDFAFAANRKFTKKESALFGDILCQLISNVEKEVRAVLAEQFADRPDAPADLINALVNDDIEVAQPILLRSKMLKDPELIEIVQLRTMQHRLAIAARGTVSEQVSDALVDSGEPKVVTKLLENKGAIFSEQSLERLVDESERITSYQEPLLLRKDLKADLAARMYRWVSAALRKHILNNFDLDPSVLDDTLKQGHRNLLAQIHMAEREKKEIHIRTLLKDPAAHNPEFLVTLLREGHVILFERLFADLIKLSLEATQKFIYGAGGEAFAIAAKAMGMAEDEFKTIFLLSRRARSNNKAVCLEEAGRALGVFLRVATDVAERVLERWRNDPGYLPFLSHFPLEQFENLEAAGAHAAS